MYIFKNELDIAELILAHNSVMCECDVEEATEQDIAQLVQASIYTDTPTTPDLFYTKSILGSTNRNKNDDVFTVAELWKSRKTPVDKMANIAHSHDKVVGHMTSTWAIDKDGNIIDDSIKAEDLPPFFHLCNSSVIYKRWQSETMQEEVNNLIEAIQAGEMKVSLEALFSDFSYALYKDGEETKFLDRNDKTSFLSKHLRAYKGDGVYDGYEVGRVIKNFILSGIGYVKKPANPSSIIFSKKEEKQEKPVKSGVHNIEAELQQSGENLMDNQVAELKEQMKTLQDENKALAEKIANANIEKTKQELDKVKADLVEAQKNSEAQAAQVKSLSEANEALAKEMESVKGEYKKAQDTIDNIKAEAMKATRTNKLVEAGLTKEDAQAKAESFAGLTDEQFDSVVSALAVVKPAPKTEDEKAAEAANELAEAEEDEDIDATAADNTDEFADLAAALTARYTEQFDLKENE